MIQNQSGSSWEEMYKVFNMGNLLEFYVPKKIAESLIEIAREYGILAQISGRVEASENKKLSIKSDKGEFVYQ
jgi:phosphoribosylformylglycinamidine cyclo-ligase